MIFQVKQLKSSLILGQKPAAEGAAPRPVGKGDLLGKTELVDGAFSASVTQHEFVVCSRVKTGTLPTIEIGTVARPFSTVQTALPNDVGITATAGW